MANSLWQLSNGGDHRLFLTESGELESVQRSILRQTLDAQASTLWGKRYRLSFRTSYENFCTELPLQTYEDIQPALAQRGAIVPEKVLKWEPTGGSSGGSKWIPWTRALQRQFRRAVAPWVNEMYLEFPELRNGRSFWQLTPQARGTSPSWLESEETGFAHDGDYLGRMGSLLERFVLLSVDRSDDEFWDRLVLSLSQAPDLTYLSCWSPSYLLVLKARFEERMGFWEPQRSWPDLRLLSCWAQGPSAVLLPAVRSAFPDVEIAGKGLLSTEAVTSIPFLGLYPLAYRSHFFEFLDQAGRVYPSWEVRVGEEYEVVQTTAAGFLRYRSGDRVRVNDTFRSIPCLEFVGRAGVEDRFGEKLSQGYLQSILDRLSGFAAIGYESGGYVLFTDSEKLLEQVEEVEKALNDVYTYRDCRKLQQLQSLRGFKLEGDPSGQWVEVFGRANPGAKFSPVLPPGKWSEHFQGRFLGPCE